MSDGGYAAEGKGFGEASAEILQAVRERAFAELPSRAEATTHLGVVPLVYPEGHQLRLVDRQIQVPTDSILVFEDRLPGANFGHPCRYHFHSPEDGSPVGREQASFPPNVADPGIPIEFFHTPLEQPDVRPSILGAIEWPSLPIYPWLEDDNRYALLFTSQISNRRHIEDLEFAYRVIRYRFGFPPANIRVLCYDGTIGAVDATAEEMAKWVGDETPYEMPVSAAATTANLQDALTELGEEMNEQSQLFIHTNNHGSTSGLCIDDSSVITPAEWGTMLNGMGAFGSLVVTMEQCYSGAFLEPTLDHSRAEVTSFASAVPDDKVSWGAAHFDPWAQAWFEGVNGVSAYGNALTRRADADRDGMVSAREAFDYSKTYNTATKDDPQYGDRPAGCGTYIYLSKPPALADIVSVIMKRFVEIDRFLFKRPIPDPPPEWGGELMGSLETAEALGARLRAIADTRPEG